MRVEIPTETERFTTLIRPRLRREDNVHSLPSRSFRFGTRPAQFDGGKCLNIVVTSFESFAEFFSGLPVRLSLALPRQSSCFVGDSKISTTNVPTLVTSVVVVDMPNLPMHATCHVVQPPNSFSICTFHKWNMTRVDCPTVMRSGFDLRPASDDG